MAAPLKTFIIYSSRDRELRDELEGHLQPLVDLQWLSLWSDKEIAPGEHWDTAIKRNLQEADIFLMLVSVDFYNSGYIREEEFKSAISRLESGHSLIIPIIVRHCNWNLYPVIKDLQVLPPDGVAVTDLKKWTNRDEAWSATVEKIGERVRKMLAERETARQTEIQKQKQVKVAAEQHAREESAQKTEEEQERLLPNPKEQQKQGLERRNRYKPKQKRSESEVPQKPVCKVCRGSGMVRRIEQTPFGMSQSVQICPTCNGSGIDEPSKPKDPFQWLYNFFTGGQ